MTFLFILLAISCSDDLETEMSIVDHQEINSDKRQLVVQGWSPPTACQASSLTYSIDPCLTGTPWFAAINTAIGRYNSADISINFSLVGAPGGDIHFDCAAFANSCLFGLGEWPTEDFSVGGTIFLSTNNLSSCTALCASPPPCFFIGLAMHEIGHNLGLGHNEFPDDLTWNVGTFTIDGNGNPVHNGATNQGEHIPGTAAAGTTDPGSIMNENASCVMSCVFNSNDLIALQSLYPVDCDCYSAELNGPANLCIDQDGEYCVSSNNNVSIQSVNWFGHPDITGNTNECVTLSSSSEGTDFIYADVTINGCIYFLSKKIEIGPPNILADLTVEIDPCLDIIKIEGNHNYTYSWGAIKLSNNNSPQVNISGSNSSIVSVRAQLSAGEELCFQVQATSECGTSYLPCEVCYTIPECLRGESDGQSNVVLPNNACNSNSQCPDGFTCQDGICCEEGVSQGDMCVTYDHCPPGFECVFGDCCHILTGLCL